MDTQLAAFGLDIGQLIADRYKVESIIGEGWNGIVLRAYDSSKQKTVAVKVFDPRFMGDKRTFTHAQFKLAVQQELDHPNIVRIHDFGRDPQNIVYSVMDLIEAGNLSRLIGNPDIDFSIIIDILKQVSTGLDYAHNHVTVHNNIKPSNVLVSESNQVFLSDFGLILFRDPLVEGVWPIIGDNLWYVAPEQLDTAAPKIEPNQQTDIYQFGILGYVLAVGEVPFPVKHTTDIERVLSLKELPPLHGKGEKCPSWFYEFLKSCTAKKINARFTSFGEVSHELTKLSDK